MAAATSPATVASPRRLHRLTQAALRSADFGFFGFFAP